MLYAARTQERIIYGSDEAIGYPLELYIPGLSVAIEQASALSYQQKEQAIKRYICEHQGIRFMTYKRTDTIEEAAAEARDVFQKLNIFIRTNEQADIQTARQKYQQLKSIPAKRRMLIRKF